MPLSMKKILMSVFCVAIFGAMVFSFLVPVPSAICLMSIFAAVGIPPIVATGFKNRGKEFLGHIPFYGKIVAVLFILTFFIIPILWQPACGSLYFFMLSGALANSILYTVELFYPGLLPLEAPEQNE